MKVIVLNVADQCVEVYPIGKDDQERYGGDDFDAVIYLSDRGLPMNDVSWMLYEDMDDIVPVFWNGENIPYITL